MPDDDIAELLEPWSDIAEGVSVGKEPILTLEARAEHCITWIERNVKIMSDKGEGLIPFLLYEYQKELVRLFWISPELIILKARQLGITELFAAIAVYCVHEFPAWTILVLSKSGSDAGEFIRKCMTIYEELPVDVQIDALNPLAKSTLNLANGSRILPKATTKGAGRGLNAQVLIMDEWAWMENQEEVYTAASPAARSAGNKIVGISTANGSGNFYHDQWLKARRGESRMTPMFLPWFSRPGRDLAWLEAATKNYEDWAKAQEYPEVEEDAFVLSGRARFNIPALHFMLAETVQPSKDVALDPEGRIWYHVWEPRYDGEVYVIGADVAEGLDKHDMSAAVCFNWRTGLEVAELWGTMEPALFAQYLNEMARTYNMAYLGVESNNHGHAVLTHLVHTYGYPHLHMRHDPLAEQGKRVGWNTNSASKPVMIDQLALAIGERRPFRNDGFVKEALTYVRIQSSSNHVTTQASGKNLDDRVMAYAIAEQMRLYKPAEDEIVEAEDIIGDYRVRING